MGKSKTEQKPDQSAADAINASNKRELENDAADAKVAAEEATEKAKAAAESGDSKAMNEALEAVKKAAAAAEASAESARRLAAGVGAGDQNRVIIRARAEVAACCENIVDASKHLGVPSKDMAKLIAAAKKVRAEIGISA